MAGLPSRLRRQAFWLSYRAAAEESGDDFFPIVHRVFNENGTFFACEDVRDGHRVFDCLAVVSKWMRVTTAWSAAKWKRAHAKGRVCDVRWPEEGASTRQFVLQWAAAVRRGARLFGSEEAILTAFRESASRERARARNRRRLPRGEPSARKGDTGSGQIAIGAASVGGPFLGLSEQCPVGEGVVSSGPGQGCLPEQLVSSADPFFGLEFGVWPDFGTIDFSLHGTFAPLRWCLRGS